MRCLLAIYFSHTLSWVPEIRLILKYIKQLCLRWGCTESKLLKPSMSQVVLLQITAKVSKSLIQKCLETSTCAFRQIFRI